MNIFIISKLSERIYACIAVILELIFELPAEVFSRLDDLARLPSHRPISASYFSLSP